MQIKAIRGLTGRLDEIRVDMDLRTPAQKVQQNRNPLAAICRMEYPFIPGKPPLSDAHPSPGFVLVRWQYMNTCCILARAQCGN